MVTLVVSLWYRSRDFDFEINFAYKPGPTALTMLIISVVKRNIFGNLLLIQAFDFEMKFSVVLC